MTNASFEEKPPLSLNTLIPVCVFYIQFFVNFVRC